MSFENGRVVEVVLRAAFGRDNHISSFHYDLDDTHNAGIGEQPNDPQTLADFFRDNVLHIYGTFFNPSWQIQPIVVREVRDPQNPNKPRQEWVSGAAGSGTQTVTNDPLPVACCAVVTHKSAHIGRRYTGRSFIGGTTQESDQSNGVWGQSRLLQIDQLFQAIPKEPDLATGPSPASAKWSVYSRTNREQSLSPYLVPVISYTIQSRVRYLRSRQV